MDGDSKSRDWKIETIHNQFPFLRIHQRNRHEPREYNRRSTTLGIVNVQQHCLFISNSRQHQWHQWRGSKRKKLNHICFTTTIQRGMDCAALPDSRRRINWTDWYHNSPAVERFYFHGDSDDKRKSADQLESIVGRQDNIKYDKKYRNRILYRRRWRSHLLPCGWPDNIHWGRWWWCWWWPLIDLVTLTLSNNDASNKTRFMKPTLIQSSPIYCQLLSHGDHGMIMVMMIMWWSHLIMID